MKDYTAQLMGRHLESTLREPLTSARRDSLAGSEGSWVPRCEVPYGGAPEPRTEGRLQATANEETIDSTSCEKRHLVCEARVEP